MKTKYGKISTISLVGVHLSSTAFENSLDPDQDRQNVGPDLDPNQSVCPYLDQNGLTL